MNGELRRRGNGGGQRVTRDGSGRTRRRRATGDAGNGRHGRESGDAAATDPAGIRVEGRYGPNLQRERVVQKGWSKRRRRTRDRRAEGKKFDANDNVKRTMASGTDAGY
ncbi:hypothetical protein GCM10020229_64560 [Kitasatospora albolonga]